jgi:hypothetical protein
MKSHPLIRACWFAVNLVLSVSLAAVLSSFIWEFSTRSYLKGFSDAIIPSSDSPEQKVEAILAWMAHGPGRRTVADPAALDQRNPQDTLNVQQLLDVCGTATNAFVNLAQSSGLQARRLLLLDRTRASKHVVAEVLVDNRWIVVDPSYHRVLRLPDGRMLTRFELQNPEIFRAATGPIPLYLPEYSYESTAHIHLGRIPLVGKRLRGILDFVWPSWEETINWTLIVERASFAMLVVSTFLLGFALAARLILGWYCSGRLGFARVRIRDRIVRVGQVLAGDQR